MNTAQKILMILGTAFTAFGVIMTICFTNLHIITRSAAINGKHI